MDVRNMDIRPLQRWFLMGGLIVVYFLAGKLGLQFAFLHSSATAVWPPTGIALAAVLLFGNRVAPAIFIGAFLVNITTAASVFSSLGIAAGNTLEAIVGGFLVTRFANGLAAFSRARDIVSFSLLAG
ncbi:MAG TPA: MASE1 domain-containing protein, partial [Burkholderiaceae bacterium]|nr:MASE1 domain-containing protein [Burkholderiaceae bacterium]